MEIELLPCPFCGTNPGFTCANDEWYVFCSDSDCPCEPSILVGRNTKEYAIAAWNKRAPTKNWRNNSEHKKPAEAQN